MVTNLSESSKVTPAVLRGPSERLKEILGEGAVFDVKAGVLYSGDTLCWFCGTNSPAPSYSPVRQYLSIWNEPGQVAEAIAVEIPRCKHCSRAQTTICVLLLVFWLIPLIGLFTYLGYRGFIAGLLQWVLGLLGGGLLYVITVAYTLFPIMDRYSKTRGIRPEPQDYSSYYIVQRLLRDGWTLGKTSSAAVPQQDDALMILDNCIHTEQKWEMAKWDKALPDLLKMGKDNTQIIMHGDVVLTNEEILFIPYYCFTDLLAVGATAGGILGGIAVGGISLFKSMNAQKGVERQKREDANLSIKQRLSKHQGYSFGIQHVERIAFAERDRKLVIRETPGKEFQLTINAGTELCQKFLAMFKQIKETSYHENIS